MDKLSLQQSGQREWKRENFSLYLRQGNSLPCVRPPLQGSTLSPSLIISSCQKRVPYCFWSTEGATESERRDLLSELNLLKKLKPHPHVIKLLGCITEEKGSYMYKLSRQTLMQLNMFLVLHKFEEIYLLLYWLLLPLTKAYQ